MLLIILLLVPDSAALRFFFPGGPPTYTYSSRPAPCHTESSTYLQLYASKFWGAHNMLINHPVIDHCPCIPWYIGTEVFPILNFLRSNCLPERRLMFSHTRLSVQLFANISAKDPHTKKKQAKKKSTNFNFNFRFAGSSSRRKLLSCRPNLTRPDRHPGWAKSTLATQDGGGTCIAYMPLLFPNWPLQFSSWILMQHIHSTVNPPKAKFRGAKFAYEAASVTYPNGSFFTTRFRPNLGKPSPLTLNCL